MTNSITEEEVKRLGRNHFSFRKIESTLSRLPPPHGKKRMLTLTPGRVLAQLLKAIRQELTDGNSAVGAAKVDVALGDGCHAQLVVGSREESGKSAGKYHVTVPHGTTYSHAHLQGSKSTRRDGGMMPGFVKRVTALAKLSSPCSARRCSTPCSGSGVRS